MHEQGVIGLPTRVDQGIAERLELCWSQGFITLFSCEGEPGVGQNEPDVLHPQRDQWSERAYAVRPIADGAPLQKFMLMRPRYLVVVSWLLACGDHGPTAGIEGPASQGAAATAVVERPGRSPLARNDVAELDARAKALDTCAVVLDSRAPAHTAVSCPKGQAYDHGAERCFTPEYAPLPAAAADGCRNGDMRCTGQVLEVCVSYAWKALRSYESEAACDKGRRLANMQSFID